MDDATFEPFVPGSFDMITDPVVAYVARLDLQVAELERLPGAARARNR